MKSRKLRALALLLSAIMIITAVPSTLFAFESVDGEVVGWDQETEAPAEVTDDFVGEVPAIEVIDEFIPDAANDEGEFEFTSAAEDVVGDYVPGVIYPVRFAYKEDGYTDGQVLIKLDENFYTPYKDDAGNVVIGKIMDVPVSCERGESFMYYAEVMGDTRFSDPIEKEGGQAALGHKWVARKPLDVIESASCVDNKDGKSYQNYYCENPGCKFNNRVWANEEKTYYLTANSTLSQNSDGSIYAGYLFPYISDADAQKIPQDRYYYDEVSGKYYEYKQGTYKAADGSSVTVWSWVESNATDAGEVVIDSASTHKAGEAKVYYLLGTGTKAATGDELTEVKRDNGTENYYTKVPVLSDKKVDGKYTKITLVVCTLCGKEIASECKEEEITLPATQAPDFDHSAVINDNSANTSVNISSSCITDVNKELAKDKSYVVKLEKIALKDCNKDGLLVVGCYDVNNSLLYTVPYEVKAPHHDFAGLYFSLDTEVIPENVPGTLTKKTFATKEAFLTSAFEKQFTVIENTDKELVVVNKSCNDSAKYVASKYCSNKHIYEQGKVISVDPSSHGLSEQGLGIKGWKESDGAKDLTATTFNGINYGKNYSVTVASVVGQCGVNTTAANPAVVTFNLICPVCGATVETKTVKAKLPLGHIWGSGVRKDTKAATCTAKGEYELTRTCDICGLANTTKNEIAALGHDKIVYKDTATEKKTVPAIVFTGAVKDEDGVYVIVGDRLLAQYGKNMVWQFEKGTDLTKNLFKPAVTTTDITLGESGYTVKAFVGYKCSKCGEYVPYKDANDNVQAIIKVTISDLKDELNCAGGTITLKAEATGITAKTETFTYWADAATYSRSSHSWVTIQNADGSTITKCTVCGKVRSSTPAPVTTTVAPVTVEPTTVVTTEAPTTVAPVTTAPTTEAPVTTAPTTEAPVVATTVAPVVEPTTEITTVEPATMPAQVTGEKVTKNSPTIGTIGVKYNAVEGADSYTVNVREPNGAWKKNPTNGAETAYDITGLTEGKCYDIRIAAVASGIAGPRSGHLYRWLKKVTLMKPTKIKGEAGAVNVTWDAADGASKYKLYVSSDKAFKQDVKTFKVTENTAKVTGLKAGTKYYFKVRCYTKGADGKTYTGGWSNVKSKTLQ